MATDDKKGVLSFLGISFGLAWTVWIGLYLADIPMGGIGMLAAFSPAIAAFVTRKYITKEGFTDLGWKPLLRRWPYYLIAWLLPLFIITACAAIVYLLGLSEINFSPVQGLKSLLPEGQELPEYMENLNIVGFAAIQLFAAIPASLVLFGEEFGWRGYLQRRVYKDSAWKSAIVVGIIWGVWHFPINLQGYNYPEHRYWGLLVFPISTIFMSYIFAWIYKNTQSIWGACLVHASINTVAGSLMVILYVDKSNFILTSLAGIVGIMVLGFISLSIHLWEKKRT